MKHYKALILDLDGTTIPNRQDGMPSQKVVEAIAKATQVMHVSVATSRPLAYAADLIAQLKLSSPCVIDGGAQIYDPITKKIIAEQAIEPKDAQTIWHFLKKNKHKFKYSNGSSEKDLPQEQIPPKVLDFIVLALDHNQADSLITQLSHIPTLALHKVSSWTEGELAVKISHTTATKLHGIITVAEMLKVKREEIIGVGDSYNDFPLLMASGLKVAMGNAVSDLKEIADYIAPSVEEDGVVAIIERFVLG